AVPKVFAEPIDGDALLDAIERADHATPGARDAFHVVDIVQMCCLGQRSGAIQLVKENRNGLIFLRAGRLVHAETPGACGLDALFEMIEWEYVEFAYDRNMPAPAETITTAWQDALIQAATLHHERTIASPKQE